MEYFSDNEFWDLYQKQLEFRNGTLPIGEFCKKYNLNKKKFYTFGYKLFLDEKKPEKYKEWLNIFKKYDSSVLTQSQFCKQNNYSYPFFMIFISHIHMNERLKILKKEMELESNNPKDELIFVEVAQEGIIIPDVRYQNSPAADLIESKNDIEIQISKGVKVSISPNIENMKIIKIIELLKDL